MRRIVRAAELTGDVVLELGPGLGSLTLGAARGGRGAAVEIDPVLPGSCGHGGRAGPALADRSKCTPPTADPARRRLPAPAPTAIVANLPYNVGVPVVLHLLAELPTLRRGLVMVQSEVAERLAARPGSKAYGVPSAKLAWFAEARRAGPVPRAVFWPVPGVDSGLLAFDRRDPPPGDRRAVFTVIDAASGSGARRCGRPVRLAGGPDAASGRSGGRHRPRGTG